MKGSMTQAEQPPNPTSAKDLLERKDWWDSTRMLPLADPKASPHMAGAGMIALIARPLEQLATAQPNEVQKIATAQQEILLEYYAMGSRHADVSFRWAIVAGCVGLILYATAICSGIFLPGAHAVLPGVVGGTALEGLASVNFYLYGRASRQLGSFLATLERSQRYLVANSICEGLEGDTKQTARADLVRAMVNPARDP
jgi:hypothetical protein